MLGLEVERIGNSLSDVDYVGVKAPHFSFTRLQGADPTVAWRCLPPVKSAVSEMTLMKRS